MRHISYKRERMRFPTRSVRVSSIAGVRIPMVRGRSFSASDHQNAPRVAIVSQTLAERFWPGHDPIGKKVQLTVDSANWIQVVGVLRDARYLAVTELRQPYLYVPFEQNYAPIQTLRVRYHGGMETAMAEVLKEITNLAPGLPVAGVETMLQQIDSSAYGFLGLRLEAGFATALGLLAQGPDGPRPRGGPDDGHRSRFGRHAHLLPRLRAGRRCRSGPTP